MVSRLYNNWEVSVHAPDFSTGMQISFLDSQGAVQASYLAAKEPCRLASWQLRSPAG